jgi:hypothetical protein
MKMCLLPGMPIVLAFSALMTVSAQTSPQSSPARQTAAGASNQGNKTAGSGPAGPAAPDTSDKSADVGVGLRVTLASSTSHISLGSIYSMSADVQNVSAKPLLVDLASIRLAVHSILSPPEKRCVWFYFPHYNDAFKSHKDSFLLQPQDHVMVLFDLSERTKADPQESCDVSFWGRISKMIDFTPGDYSFGVSGYFSSATAQGDSAGPQRPFTQSTNFQVGIDQTWIVIFASIGGVLAYLLASITGARESKQLIDRVFDTKKETFSYESLKLLMSLAVKVAGAALLSGAFAIVAARTSDIQFPIKVSILDGWGAITIGFLAYFAGGKFIQTLTSWYNKPAGQTAQTKEPVVGAEATVSPSES